MPKKSKITTVIEPEVEIVEEIEVKPKKHIVQVWKKRLLPEYNTSIDDHIGEVIYWESTDDITFSYESHTYGYMQGFATRAIKVGNKWILREKAKEWFENLPFATFDEGYFAGVVLTLDEIE